MPITLLFGEMMSGMSSPCHGRRGGAVRDHLAVGPGPGLHRRHSLRNSRTAAQTTQDLTEVRVKQELDHILLLLVLPCFPSQ